MKDEMMMLNKYRQHTFTHQHSIQSSNPIIYRSKGHRKIKSEK